MAIRHRIDPDRDLLEVVLSGGVSVDDILTSFDVIRRDPLFRSDMPEIWDLSAVTDFPLFSPQITRIVEQDRPNAFEIPARVAFLTPPDHLYGLGRIYETLTDDARFNARPFRSREEAEQWILAS